MIKICFFGMGSIGRKHLKNLRKIEKEKNLTFHISAFRSTNKKLDNETAKLLDEEIFDLEDQEFDIVFITNPTSLHYETLRKTINIGKNFFIEKPLFSNLSQKINSIEWKPDSIYYVACPLRFNKVIRYLKENVNIKEVYAFRIISSSYLPDWRHGIDYRENYSAIKELGGGVSLDLIHELDYVKYIFGTPEKIWNLRRKLSHLEITSEDLSLYLLNYENTVGEIHLDYFGRENRREIEIFLKNEEVIGNLIKNQIRFLKSNKILNFDDEENCYMRELRYFIDKILANEKTFNEYNVAYDTLKLAEGAEPL